MSRIRVNTPGIVMALQAKAEQIASRSKLLFIKEGEIKASEHFIKGERELLDRSSNLQISTSTRRILNGCRRQKSIPLYANGHRRKSDLSDRSEPIGESAATLEDIDRFMFENFRSLYREKYDSDLEEEGGEESETPATYDSSDRPFETPDLTPSESRQFFVSPKPDGANESLRGEEYIAVLKASADPVEDFRRSMRDVMAARERQGEVVDWGFMEELLFSYLRMNEKKHFRFVLDAFVDSVMDMRRNSCDAAATGAAVTEEEVPRARSRMLNTEY